MAEASDAAAAPIPPDVRALLERQPGLGWERVAWDAVRARAARLDRVEGLAGKSRLRAREARALIGPLRGPG